MSLQATRGPADPYKMVTAHIVDKKVVFNSDADFEEVKKVGFFRIKTPDNLDLELGRIFAKTFTSIPRYREFGALDIVNGYLQSDIAQTVRFSLERDFWNLQHSDGNPNYPIEIQKLGRKMNKIGMRVLQSILEKCGVPKKLWFRATGGCSEGEGSYFLTFNCYDPKLAARPYGVGAHKDWGHVTVLDATQPGLQAKIDGIWRDLDLEDGYLTINFGHPLQKLLPGVNASEHRVLTQDKVMRTSIVAFGDPRVGPYRKGVTVDPPEGHVYDYNRETQELFNGESTVSYFEKSSKELYGANQTDKEG